MLIRAILPAFLIIGFSGNALAQQAIGTTQVIVRTVLGDLESAQRTLAKADPVHANENIITRKDSATELRFIDETMIKVGPDAQVALDRFVFDPSSGAEQVTVNMVKGMLRFISGKMRKSAYAIRTPAATISVRGTIFTLNVRGDGSTALHVEEGEVTVEGTGGGSVDVTAGLATTVTVTAAPTPPAKPSVALAIEVAKMDMLAALAGSVSSPMAVRKAGQFGRSLPANSLPQKATDIPGASCSSS